MPGPPVQSVPARHLPHPPTLLYSTSQLGAVDTDRRYPLPLKTTWAGTRGLGRRESARWDGLLELAKEANLDVENETWYVSFVHSSYPLGDYLMTNDDSGWNGEVHMTG
jgi:hypothetical protein